MKNNMREEMIMMAMTWGMNEASNRSLIQTFKKSHDTFDPGGYYIDDRKDKQGYTDN
jgi:hypothetical protein